MMTVNMDDLHLSVANYWAARNSTGVRLNFDESMQLFSRPYDIVTINEYNEVDAVLIIRNSDYLEFLEHSMKIITTNGQVQRLWVCLDDRLLPHCEHMIDKHTGILIYKQTYPDVFKIAELKPAVKLHDRMLESDILVALLKLQSKGYWKRVNQDKVLNQISDLFY